MGISFIFRDPPGFKFMVSGLYLVGNFGGKTILKRKKVLVRFMPNAPNIPSLKEQKGEFHGGGGGLDLGDTLASLPGARFFFFFFFFSFPQNVFLFLRDVGCFTSGGQPHLLGGSHCSCCSFICSFLGFWSRSWSRRTRNEIAFHFWCLLKIAVSMWCPTLLGVQALRFEREASCRKRQDQIRKDVR
eukprot:FR736465.1.p2 GENE.FR736465.1~~FR736465.1.p2  ORF type:complete len:187 (-),score=40.43 FR736465.1:472-1032(-)